MGNLINHKKKMLKNIASRGLVIMANQPRQIRMAT